MKRLYNRVRNWVNKQRWAFWYVFSLSRITDIFLTRGRYHVTIPELVSAEEALEQVEILDYSPDVFEFGNFKIKHGVMFPPEYIQWHLNQGLPVQTDCDEFARYAQALLEKVWNVHNVRLLTVRWEMPDASLEGHNTCVFSYLNESFGQRFGTLCNWGLKLDYSSVEKAARYFVEATEGKLLAYTVSDSRMRILKHVKY